MDAALGPLLRRYRTESGLTQEGLAERSGLSVGGISALERGAHRFPQRPTLRALADALSLSPQQRHALLDAGSRGSVGPPPAVPRQLPRAIAEFTGRGAELARLTALFSGAEPPVVAITGMAGVGKTALAVHTGHALSGLFPGGQLYLDLHGYGSERPLTAAEALRYLLRSLGEDASALDFGTATEKFRQLTADQGVLLVLDNAADAEQVADLVSGCAALVTSRGSLAGLDAVRLQLDVLSDADAVALLDRIGGRGGGSASASSDVVRLCGHLPLAIRLAGARLASRPSWPVEHLVELLADERRRLDDLEVGDHSVRAAFAISVDHLDATAATALALLGLPNFDTIGLDVAARLLDVSAADAEPVLQRLVDANLLVTVGPGRYQFHDLVRLFVREQPVPDPAAALTRVHDLFVAVAWQTHSLRRNTLRQIWADPRWTAAGPDFGTVADALNWLDTERDNVEPAVADAARSAHPERAVRLVLGLDSYYVSRHEWTAMLAVNATALDLVGDDPVAEGLLRHSLGVGNVELGRHEIALSHFQAGLDHYRAAGHTQGEASTLMTLAHACVYAGRFAEGIGHAERALELSQRIGNDLIEAYSHQTLGKLYAELGDRQRQIESHQAGRVIFDKLGDRLGIAISLCDLGVADAKAGESEAALLHWQEALELFTELGRPSGQTTVLEHLGRVCHDLGRHDQAIEWLDQGLTVATSHGETRRQATLHHHLGATHAALGHTSAAIDHLETALHLATRHNLPTASTQQLLDDLLNHPEP